MMFKNEKIKLRKLIISACFVIGTAGHLAADNAAAPVRFVDRLYIDAGGTFHVPQNFPTMVGGLGGLGFATRDFSMTLNAKVDASITGMTLTDTIFGLRIEPRFNLIPNTLRLLPSIYVGYSSGKATVSDGNSIKVEGFWIETGIGAELMATQDISLLPRLYYAFNKLGTTPPNYADLSALGMDIGVRYYLGQSRRLSY